MHIFQIIFLLFNFLTLHAQEMDRNLVYKHLVDIGEGRRMFLTCLGRGSPTVIFISGRSDTSVIWQKGSESVFDEVAKFTKVCAYDRPGTVSISEQDSVTPSLSTSVTQPITAEKGVEDLHALLLAAKVLPPYVLVAHSYGGLIARLYASN